MIWVLGAGAAIGLAVPVWFMWHINHLDNLETKRIEQVYGFKRSTLKERLNRD